MRIYSKVLCISVLGLASIGCSDGSDNGLSIAPDEGSVFAVANGCFAISPDGGQSFISSAGDSAGGSSSGTLSVGLDANTASEASRFLLRPSDLGKYLLYDERQQYLTSDGQNLLAQTSLASDISEVNGEVVVEDRLQSEGEWQLLAASNGQFTLQHIKSGTYIGADGTMVAEADAADVSLVEQTECAVFPGAVPGCDGRGDRHGV